MGSEAPHHISEDRVVRPGPALYDFPALIPAGLVAAFLSHLGRRRLIINGWSRDPGPSLAKRWRSIAPTNLHPRWLEKPTPGSTIGEYGPFSVGS